MCVCMCVCVVCLCMCVCTYVPWFSAGGMLSREYCKCGGMAGGSLMYSSGSTGGHEYLEEKKIHISHAKNNQSHAHIEATTDAGAQMHACM